MEKESTFQWKGRTDHPGNWSDFRYHQIIGEEGPAVVIGFCCDEGVQRNKGNPGAAEGPDAIRASLASLPWRANKETHLVDAGNVVCEGAALEEAQEKLGNLLCAQYAQARTPFILGGGHETFYGHYLGARKYLGPDKKIGMINIDAHFDMRPYDEQTSSGTMFRQILEADPKAGYLVLGIQKFGNTESLFEKAEELGCQYLLEEEMDQTNVQGVIQQFMEAYDAVILTLCMDVIEAAHAPGVSAPSPFGLHPKTVRQLIRQIMGQDKTLSFDVSEINPLLDQGGKTVKLGANLVNEAIMAKLGNT